MEETKGLGADRGCECVGYQAHDPQGHENNSLTLNDLVESVRFTGGIGTVGVYVPQDPGGPDDLSREGKSPLRVRQLLVQGTAHGHRAVPRSSATTATCATSSPQNKVKPSWIVSHDLPLEQAPEAYKHFDAREQGWTKVVLHPGQAG